MANTPSKLGSGNAWPHGPPDAQRVRGLERDLVHRQLAVGLDGVVRAGAGRKPARDLLVEGAREAVEIRERDREPGRHRVPAEFADELGMVRGHGIEHVADVHAGHRARRAAQRVLARLARTRSPGGARDPSRGSPRGRRRPGASSRRRGRRRCAERRAARIAKLADRGERLRLHARFDGPALLVELVRAARRARWPRPGRPRAGTGCRCSCRRCGPAALRRGATLKARSVAVRSSRWRPANFEQRADAGRAPARLNAPQALRDEHAVVGVERHDVRDGAERDQVEKLRRARRAGGREASRIRAGASRRPSRRTQRRRRRARGCRNC